MRTLLVRTNFFQANVQLLVCIIIAIRSDIIFSITDDSCLFV